MILIITGLNSTGLKKADTRKREKRYCRVHTTTVIPIRLPSRERVLIVSLYKHTYNTGKATYLSPNIRTNTVLLCYTPSSVACPLMEGSRCHNLISHTHSTRREGARCEKGESRNPRAHIEQELKSHKRTWGSPRWKLRTSRRNPHTANGVSPGGSNPEGL